MTNIILIIALILLDQFTKFVVSTSMTLNQSISIIDNFFYLTYVRNDGAGFSLLKGQRYFFIAITIFALVIFFYLYKDAKENKLLQFCVSLMIAGTIGNFIDRLLVGTVVDFLDFHIFSYNFPVFNVADICLTVGVFLYLFFSFRGKNV